MRILKTTRFVFLAFIIVLLFYVLSSLKKYNKLKDQYNKNKILVDSLKAENKLQAGKLSAITHYYNSLFGKVIQSGEMKYTIDSITNKKNKFYDSGNSK